MPGLSGEFRIMILACAASFRVTYGRNNSYANTRQMPAGLSPPAEQE